MRGIHPFGGVIIPITDFPSMADDGREARYRSLDIFKGVAISVIVILHIGIVAKAGMGELAPPLQALYLGLVGFFMMVGYFFKPGRGFRENMMRRVRFLLLALVIASVLLSVICFVWCLLWNQPTDLGDLVFCLQRAFCVERTFVDYDVRLPWAICGFTMGYYYLWVLLGACAVFYAIADRVRDDWRLGLVAVAILVAVTVVYRETIPYSLPFYLNLWPIATVFMISGMYLAKYNLIGRMERAGLRDRGFWIVLIVSAACLMLMAYLLPPTIDFDYMGFGKYGGYSAIPYVAEGILAFIMLSHVFFILSRIPVISSLFADIGKHTMGVLLLHVFVAKTILAPFFTFDDVNCLPADFVGIGRILFAIASLAISYLICAYGPLMLAHLFRKA